MQKSVLVSAARSMKVLALRSWLLDWKKKSSSAELETAMWPSQPNHERWQQKKGLSASVYRDPSDILGEDRKRWKRASLLRRHSDWEMEMRANKKTPFSWPLSSRLSCNAAWSVNSATKRRSNIFRHLAVLLTTSKPASMSLFFLFALPRRFLSFFFFTFSFKSPSQQPHSSFRILFTPPHIQNESHGVSSRLVKTDNHRLTRLLCHLCPLHTHAVFRQGPQQSPEPWIPPLDRRPGPGARTPAQA